MTSRSPLTDPQPGDVVMHGKLQLSRTIIGRDRFGIDYECRGVGGNLLYHGRTSPKEWIAWCRDHAAVVVGRGGEK